MQRDDCEFVTHCGLSLGKQLAQILLASKDSLWTNRFHINKPAVKVKARILNWHARQTQTKPMCSWNHWTLVSDWFNLRLM